MKNKRQLLIILTSIFLGIIITLLAEHFGQHNPLPQSSKNIPASPASPVYYDFTVDKDTHNTDESEIIVPTAMTDGAGKLLIVKKGKIIFESPELAEIGIKASDDGDGFILEYETERDLLPVEYEARYRYKEGKFVEDLQLVEALYFTPSQPQKSISAESEAIAYLRQKLQISQVKTYWLATTCVTYIAGEQQDYYQIEIHEYHNEGSCPGAKGVSPLAAMFRVNKSDNNITVNDVFADKFIPFNDWIAENK